MAYDVSNLSIYVEQNRLPLLKAAILKGKTLETINRQSGVKGTAALNILSVSAPLGDGSDCGFSASGNDTFSQREIETKILKVNKEWCYKTLLGKWTETQMRNGIVAGDKQLTFEEFLMEAVTEDIAKQMEVIAWQGKASSPAITGLIAQYTGASQTVGTLQGSTDYAKVLEVYAAIPEAVLDKAMIFVDPSTFRGFVQGLVSANLYHYNPDAPKDEVTIPGTETRVIKVNGLINATATGENSVSLEHLIVAADPMNLFYGYDVEDSQETFEVWYSKDNGTIRLRMETNAGFQIAFPGEVVIFGSPSV